LLLPFAVSAVVIGAGIVPMVLRVLEGEFRFSGFVGEPLFSGVERYILAAALTGQNDQGNITTSIFWPRGFQEGTDKKKIV